MEFSKRHILTAIFPIISILGFLQNLSAQEPRTFTNQSGAEIEARFLDFVGDSNIRISRTSDGKEFELPVSSLSLGDQQYLAAVREKKAARAAGVSDGTLTIRFPGDGGAFEPDTARQIFGDSSRDIHIDVPAGNWIHFRVSLGGARLFIPYFGETEWIFEYGDNDTFWLTRGSGVKELIGIHLPYVFEGEKNDHRERLRDIDLGKVKHIFNVTASQAEDLEIISMLPDELPLGVDAQRPMSASTLRKLQRENLVSLSARLEFDEAKHLESLPTLRCLNLDVGITDADDVFTLPPYPKLEHLALAGVGARIPWNETLAGLSELRSLTIGRIGDKEPAAESPISDFSGTPSLNTLILNGYGGNYFEFQALRSAPGLRAVKITSSDLVAPPSDFGPLTDLNSLIAVDLSIAELTVETLDIWFQSGRLSGLRRYRSPKIPLLENCPDIDTVQIIASGFNEGRDFARFSGAPESLRRLEISGLGGDAEKVKLPFPNSLHELALIDCEIPGPEFLYYFPELTFLSLGRIGGSVDSIDLSKFAKLRSIHISDVDSLVSIVNLAPHRTLNSFTFYDNASLADLGRPAPNSVLERAGVTELPALKSLDCLSETTGIREFRLSRCDAITTVDEVKEGNQFERIWIVGCAQLPNESNRSLEE